MAILTGKEIQKKIKSGKISITPYNKMQLNPNSYNLRLHDEIMIYESFLLDSKEKNSTKKIKIPESGYMLLPNELYLARTVERTHTDCYVPIISGRSSTGRLGINVHATAGYGDVGFNGFWTLEIFVIQPVAIYPNIEICQVYFNTVKGDIELYRGKYQNNSGIQASELWKDF